MTFLAEIEKSILKFEWNLRGPLNSKTVLKKNEVGGLSFPKFKTYYTKQELSRQYDTGKKTDI